MSNPTASPRYEAPPVSPGLRTDAREVTGYWWLGLVTGIAWIVISVVILQFDQASITTVGVLVGFMFLFAGAQSFLLAGISDGATRVVSVLFGVLLSVSAVICFISPEDTFAGMADILGFLFLIVGLWWMVQAFLERAVNPLWWLTLISGILMTGLAFWTAGQFFIEKAYLLLVFAGIWALMAGITDIVRAFQVRELREEI
jgi:uncharacterized membrane protein HdeD (DUF308 family)